jgi:hypothetical protein
MSKVLVVFTAKGSGRIESAGGTASWALSIKSMRDCEYVICTRNTDQTKVKEFGNQTDVPHRAAFLVGKVAGLLEVGLHNGRMRYRVLLSEVADVLVPEFWDGSRVPTRYLTDIEAKQRGVDISALKFRKISEPSSIDVEGSEEASQQQPLPGLSIGEAKAGLAARFGVSIDDVDIVIRG